MTGFDKETLVQSARFLLVGATSSGVYLLVLALMVELLAASVVAGVIVAYLTGTVVSYLGMTRFAFGAKPDQRNLIRFLSVVALSFVLNVSMAHVLEGFGLHYLVIGVAIVVTVSLVNFLLHKHWTYAESVRNDAK